MSEDIMEFDMERAQPANIKVIGVGGGGGNAVRHMFKYGIKDVDFVLCNTDSQALIDSPIPNKIQLGESLTGGRGAGNKPEIGRESALENISEIEKVLKENTQMVFVTAGMGGGTGTGAAPVIAQTAKENNILTVGIVTVPFRFEGRRRIEQAMKGIEELKQHVDSLLVINNERVREMYGNLAISDAFARADDVLAIGAKGIAEIITVHGQVNVDFADVQTVMTDSGVAIMGSARTEGEDRARIAIEEALHSPLLNNADIRGAKDILLNITSGSQEVTMDEISDITEYIIDEAGDEVNMIWGSVHDETLGEAINVTIIATGFEMEELPDFSSKKTKAPKKVELPSEQKPGRTVVTLGSDSEKKVELGGDNNSKSKIQQKINFGDGTDADGSDTSLYSNDDTESGESSEFQVHTRAKKPFSYDEVKNLEDISDFENVPAFVRKKQQGGQDEKKKTELSKFKLTEDDEGRPRLRPDNPFLYDNVD